MGDQEPILMMLGRIDERTDRMDKWIDKKEGECAEHQKRTLAIETELTKDRGLVMGGKQVFVWIGAAVAGVIGFAISVIELVKGLTSR